MLSTRQQVISEAKTFIIKVGTNVLSKEDDSLNEGRITTLAGQIHKIRESGRKVVLVSSGAVGAGMERLGLTTRPTDLPHLQAAAAIGQAQLIGLYDRELGKYGHHVAQLLMTANDFKNRSRYINVRNTLRTLFEFDAIPIINENDTVSIDEIGLGDNDSLAALVANLLDQPLLVILSGVDGLLDGDPDQSDSQVVSVVETWDSKLFELVAPKQSSRGKGGMAAKLKAIHNAVSVGENVILANGKNDTALEQILNCEEIGTFFPAQSEFVPAWKRWIGYNVPPLGHFTVDDGARKAIESQGRSLLAIGITKVKGDFQMGEVVSIRDSNGAEFARGLTNYSSEQVSEIFGKRSEEIFEILGEKPFSEVIHRDNLVVTN